MLSAPTGPNVAVNRVSRIDPKQESNDSTVSPARFSAILLISYYVISGKLVKPSTR